MPAGKGLAIVTMLVFTIIFAILAMALLMLVGSHTILLEDGIRRVKATYAAEAGVVQTMDLMRRGQSVSGLAPVEWVFDQAGNPTFYKDVNITTAAGTVNFSNTTRINSRCDYTHW